MLHISILAANIDKMGLALQPNRPLSDMTGGLPPVEHMPLDDNRYVADILYEMKNAKSKDSQEQAAIQKRMFRETDETITEPQFVNLSYVRYIMPQAICLCGLRCFNIHCVW